MRNLRVHRRTLTRVVASLLLLVIGVGAAGVPLFPVVQKDRSTPFYCQDRACGCRDAEACWRGCCCATDQQKQEWARRHGVRVPVAHAQPMPRPDETLEPRGTPRDCCRTKSSGTALPRESSHADCHGNDQRAEGHCSTIVLSSAQAHCQGLGPLVYVLSCGLPFVPQFELAAPMITGWLRAAPTAPIASPIFPPPSPPPRTHA
jgi:hypothetical protein